MTQPKSLNAHTHIFMPMLYLSTCGRDWMKEPFPAILLALCFALVGCDGTSSKTIGDYKLIRTHSSFNALMDLHGKDVIPANIEQLGVTNRWLYGYLNPADYVKIHWGEDQPTSGYFIFDLQTGDARFSLTENEMTDFLSNEGVEELRLKRL